MAKIINCSLELSLYEYVDGSIESVIAKFEALQEEHSKAGHKNLKLDFYQHYDDAGLTLTYDRPETVQERRLRLVKQRRQRAVKQAAKASRLERERKEYERLKKQFG
jgi:hypothetical protein